MLTFLLYTPGGVMRHDISEINLFTMAFLYALFFALVHLP